MNRESLKKNRFVRTLAFHFRNWRESRSFTSGSGHSIVKRGVCVDSQIQIQGSNNFVLLDMDSDCSEVKSKSMVRTIGLFFTLEHTFRG